MTTKTTYICDRCGTSRESITDKPMLWNINLTARPYGQYSYSMGDDPRPTMWADWCQPCCELLGLKLEYPLKADKRRITLNKEQLDNTIREVLQGVLRRGLEKPTDKQS